MAETLADFFDRVAEGREPGFRPEPWYSADGDCIHYHWRSDEFFRDWVDDKLTLYRSIETKEAVGCQIKGVAALLKKLGDFGISLSEHDGAPLVLFVFASQNTAKDSKYDPQERDKTYRYLIEQVAKQRIELEPATGT